MAEKSVSRDTPAILWRVITSLFVMLIWISVTRWHNAIRGPLDAKVAAMQLNDGVMSYTWAQLWIGNELVPTVVLVVGVMLLAWIWWAVGKYGINNLERAS